MQSNLMRQDTRQPLRFPFSFTKPVIWLSMLVVPGLAPAQQPGFVGSWNLVKGQSDFGIMPHNIESITISISHTDDHLDVKESTRYAEQLEKLDDKDKGQPKVTPARTATRAYAIWLDGKPHQDSGAPENCKNTATKNGSAISVKLACTTEEGYPQVVIDHWTLESAGRTLRIERTLNSLPSSAKLVLLFQKQ